MSDPHLSEMIHNAAFAFCDATNKTTTLQLNTALSNLRTELDQGMAIGGEQGADTLPELTKRVKSVFTEAEDYRAERIAATEASRAVHAAQMESATESGVVVAVKLLLSGDACDLCRKIHASMPSGGWPLGTEMYNDGRGHPDYSSVEYPPLHPNCQCSCIEITDIEYAEHQRQQEEAQAES